jgi:SAM-dependent methyltransferase
VETSRRREQLRGTFAEDAALYDRMRPGYPAALFEDLARFGQLGPGARVLEIGCGTGQATRSLAGRGYHVTALDLGPGMVAVARANLAAFEHVEVAVAAFESWPLPEQPFDAVVSATAFHWLDPTVRVARAAAALRPQGTLALISTHHVAGGDTPFFEQVQACYERWDPSTPPGLRLPSIDEIPADSAELDSSGLFEPAVIHHYTWSQSYTASEYRDLLLTYSGHRALDATRRERLLRCITDLIETRFSGRITKQYLNQLCLARRRS